MSASQPPPQQTTVYQAPPQAAPAPVPQPAAPAEPGYMAELEKLAALQASGVLSQEEFEAKKRQILGI